MPPPNQARGRPSGSKSAGTAGKTSKSKASASTTSRAGAPQRRAKAGARSKGRSADVVDDEGMDDEGSREASEAGGEDEEEAADSRQEDQDLDGDMAAGGAGPEEAEAAAAADGKTVIPPELLTRLLHEFFERDGTRISKEANKAVAKYMDIFVREAIARAAVEKGSGFLEVEDLEKVAPQLLLDL